MEANQQILRIGELCQYLRIGPSTVYQLRANDPTFPRGTKIGKSIRWLRSDVEAWFRNKSESSGQEVAR